MWYFKNIRWEENYILYFPPILYFHILHQIQAPYNIKVFRAVLLRKRTIGHFKISTENLVFNEISIFNEIIVIKLLLNGPVSKTVLTQAAPTALFFINKMKLHVAYMTNIIHDINNYSTDCTCFAIFSEDVGKIIS